jgi:hypothetical protein
MIPGSTLTSFATLVFGVSVFIFIMLLSALLELKKPRDAGPRVIINDVAIPQLHVRIAMLEKSEDKVELGQTILRKIADIIAVLPNLETHAVSSSAGVLRFSIRPERFGDCRGRFHAKSRIYSIDMCIECTRCKLSARH